MVPRGVFICQSTPVVGNLVQCPGIESGISMAEQVRMLALYQEWGEKMLRSEVAVMHMWSLSRETALESIWGLVLA